MRKETKKCPYCNTTLSRSNPYGICFVHQEKVIRERLPVHLRKELRGLELEVSKQEKRPVGRKSIKIYHGLTLEEIEQMRNSLSKLLKDYSDEELIEILKNPEETYESLLMEDENKAKGFAEAVILLREKKEEVLQEFLR